MSTCCMVHLLGSLLTASRLVGLYPSSLSLFLSLILCSQEASGASAAVASLKFAMDVRLAVWGAFGGVGFVFFLVLIELLRRFNSDNKNNTSGVMDGTSSSRLSIVRDFPYQQLEIATNGFAPENVIKEGHCGKLYGGVLEGGEAIVVKCIDVAKVGIACFEAEMEGMGGLCHNRLLPLLGLCVEDASYKMLVFKQMPNGDLATALRRADEFKSSDGESDESKSSDSTGGSSKPLDWITRFKIAIGVAEGLVYLHHECSPPVVHRDLKSSSVLLDVSYEVRLGSMGKACRQQHSNVFPVYDVYCYGRILLDLVSGLDISGGSDAFGEAWLHKAMPLMDLQHQEAFLRLVDPMLVVDEDHVKELMLLAVIARSCIDPEHVQHQTMSNILKMLQNPAFVGIG